MAPTVVSAIETRVIGPMPASDVGRLKIATPMMLPMIKAIATGRPKPLAWPAPVPSSGLGCTTAGASPVTESSFVDARAETDGDIPMTRDQRRRRRDVGDGIRLLVVR